MESEERRWVVKPDEVNLNIAVGKDAKISPAIREALEHLANVLGEQDEVSGYMYCPDVSVTDCAYHVRCNGVQDKP